MIVVSSLSGEGIGGLELVARTLPRLVPNAALVER